MEVLEMVLLVLAYTLIIVTIFMEIVCYKRNIETLETIWFTISLLVLIITLTASRFLNDFDNTAPINVFTQFSMVFVGLMTILNVMEERKHSIQPLFKKVLIGISGILILSLIAAHFLQFLDLLEYVVSTFLGLSVLFSMILIKRTKPVMRIAHRERIEQYTAIGFIVAIPLALAGNYWAEQLEVEIKMGFILPLVFIVLAMSKLLDDLNRLSLFKPTNNVTDQNLKNYSLTKRESEIVLLLIKGKTYVQIASELFISVPTVKTHTTNIYQKCKVQNRAELISVLTN